MKSDVLEPLLADLDAESRQLDGWVRDLDPGDWRTVTTPECWTVAHQLGHLAWTDVASYTAIADPDGFGRMMKEAAADPSGFVDAAADQWADLEPAVLLQRWRSGREQLADALRSVPDGDKVAWFGPPMSPASMATARLMETWAHGRDVAAALDIEAPRDDRARHIAHLATRTRDYAYQLRGEDPPAEAFRVELTGPRGDTWAWGPQDADQSVRGAGYDFALLAVRRLHRDDAGVWTSGEDAEHWLGIIQAFAGQPGNDPKRKADDI